ncbi:MAG: hypothetical protein Q8N70_09230, partial [Deltaproteobacteria bacterium]|nr:hypothetical protein [Deltaproteobacteria bacterium]
LNQPVKPVQGMVQGDKKAIATQSPDGGGCPLRQARCAARGWPPAQAPPQRGFCPGGRASGSERGGQTFSGRVSAAKNI